jgi:hypothetical protein
MALTPDKEYQKLLAEFGKARFKINRILSRQPGSERLQPDFSPALVAEMDRLREAEDAAGSGAG